MTAAVLEVRGLTVRYGGVLANASVDLRISAGEVVGLIGPNGAGKTTFVDAVTGITPSSGVVRVAGRRIDGLAAHRRRAAGLARTWQSGELFTDLTVRQNLAVASGRGVLRGVRDDLTGRGPTTDVDSVLASCGLLGVADRRPGELSPGEQKLVGVGRALVGTPQVVLLDEPAAGLDTDQSAEFGARVRTMADTGLAVLLIEHDMSLVFKTCDRIDVLNYGHLIAGGPPDTIRENPAVIEAYLGTETTP